MATTNVGARRQLRAVAYNSTLYERLWKQAAKQHGAERHTSHTWFDTMATSGHSGAWLINAIANGDDLGETICKHTTLQVAAVAASLELTEQHRASIQAAFNEPGYDTVNNRYNQAIDRIAVHIIDDVGHQLARELDDIADQLTTKKLTHVAVIYIDPDEPAGEAATANQHVRDGIRNHYPTSRIGQPWTWMHIPGTLIGRIERFASVRTFEWDTPIDSDTLQLAADLYNRDPKQFTGPRDYLDIAHNL